MAKGNGGLMCRFPDFLIQRHSFAIVPFLYGDHIPNLNINVIILEDLRSLTRSASLSTAM